ncbi:MAG: isovaleryl-CoA dehydrogenase [Gemmatimonadaceae bacterium]
MATADRFATHRVENQPPPLAPYDSYATDLPLREALDREGGAWAESEIAAYGPVAGGELMELGFAANENKPRLRAFDRYGHRIDDVEFHPAYHRIMQIGIAHGVPSFAWNHESRTGAHVARAALAYLHMQPDQGNNCPLTMTYASAPVLRHHSGIAAEWVPRVTAREYDPRAVPAWDKRGNTIGMGMTEKQGGSDLRRNTTHAHAIGSRGAGELYELVGHKWFFSAPMSDAFLVLAQTDAGPSCFLMPRFAPDGELNAVRIQRLKDKLGDWSNASAEVELQGAVAWLIGEEGRGIATIIEMVALTRQDCVIGSSAIMRQALVQAIHHSQYRQAFGKLLIDQPLMRAVLADLALESEASVALSLRVARAVDASSRDGAERGFARVATAIAKYYVCKRCVPFVNEAQECLGGNGYIEESILPRLYRQAPVNSIWEGSGNIQCLDVLRALERDAEAREALFAELESTRGSNLLLDLEIGKLDAELDHADGRDGRARWIVGRMAVALEASLLFRAGNAEIADAFCESRLGEYRTALFGAMGPKAPVDLLISRAFPDVR